MDGGALFEGKRQSSLACPFRVLLHAELVKISLCGTYFQYLSAAEKRREGDQMGLDDDIEWYLPFAADDSLVGQQKSCPLGSNPVGPLFHRLVPVGDKAFAGIRCQHRFARVGRLKSSLYLRGALDKIDYFFGHLYCHSSLFSKSKYRKIFAVAGDFD